MSIFLKDSNFIISCAARTGSTMLVHMLRSNPEIMCHGEVFNYRNIGGLAGRYNSLRKSVEHNEALLDLYRRDPNTFLYKVVFDSQERKIAGFKIKTDEIFRRPYSRLRRLLKKDTDIKVLHLYRADLIGQFVSLKVVHDQTGVTLIHSDDQRPTVKPFTADAREFQAFLKDVFRREQKSLDLYGAHRSFMISYEEAIEADAATLQDMQLFLGVNPKPLETTTVKILNHPTSETLLNYQEIEDIYQDVAMKRPIKLFADSTGVE